MRCRWNIRIYHLPDRTRAPFHCHICGTWRFEDLSAEHENLTLTQMAKRLRCEKCDYSPLDFKGSLDKLLWKDDE